jgi:hypothetical protein
VEGCANPQCTRPHPHGKGQIFLCAEDAKNAWATARTNTIHALWVCDNCSEHYVVTFDRTHKSVLTKASTANT